MAVAVAVAVVVVVGVAVAVAVVVAVVSDLTKEAKAVAEKLCNQAGLKPEKFAAYFQHAFLDGYEAAQRDRILAASERKIK